MSEPDIDVKYVDGTLTIRGEKKEEKKEKKKDYYLSRAPLWLIPAGLPGAQWRRR